MSLGDLLLGEAVATARERDIAARNAQASGAGQATATGMAIGFGLRAQRAEQWAQELENTLNEAEAHAGGVSAVCAELISELAKVAPSNWLLNKSNRDKIYDSGYEKEMARRQD